MRFFRRGGTRLTPTLSSLDAYALWAETYPPQAHNALMRAEEAAVLSLMPDVTGAAILDLACGTGRYGRIARERGAAYVTGIDNSLPMLKGNPLAERVQATTERLPLRQACMDGLICGLALGHLPSLLPSFVEMARVLKPGGWGVVSDVHPFIALSGAQRTFRAQGATFAVEHYPHLYSAYVAAAYGAGLSIETVLEPALLPEDQHAASAGGTPVVIVYRFRKQGASDFRVRRGSG